MIEDKAFKDGVARTVMEITTLVLLLAGSAGAVPVEEWNRTFGGAMFEIANSVQQTSDGGFIIAGLLSDGPTKYHAFLIKTDANGNQQWGKTFGGKFIDEVSSFKQTSDGGYILAILGDSVGFRGAAIGDAWLIKTDANGNQQWNRTFGEAKDINYDNAKSVQQTSDGGYILTGETNNGSAVNSWLIKTDVNGNQKWNRTFGGASLESGQQTSDGGYILAGKTTPYGETFVHALLVKTDANGNQQWNITFGGANFSTANSVQQTSDGGYILAGSTSSDREGKAWLIKVKGDATETTKAPTAGRSQKVSGFGVVVAITTLSVLYTLGRKRR